MPEDHANTKCPDCCHCQMCSESRCRLCREKGGSKMQSGLGSSFTYGQYTEWLKNKHESSPKAGHMIAANDEMTKIPVIDIRRCTGCESCIEISPSIFQKNGETDNIEVVDHDEYDEEEIRKAICICPADCISWD